MYYKTSGIVLNRNSINEADKLVTIYTYQFGKIKTISAGANKITAKLLVATEPLVETNFMLYTNLARSSRMKIVGGEIVNLFPQVRTDLNRYTTACQVVEIVDLLTSERLQNEKKYYLLRRTLQLLERCTHYKRIYLAFLLRFLALCGYKLELDRCIKCFDRKVAPQGFPPQGLPPQGLPSVASVASGLRFSLIAKGILCKKCDKFDYQSVEIDRKTLDCFRKLSKLSGDEVEKMDVPVDIENFIAHQCRLYLSEYLPWALKTEQFKIKMGAAPILK